jgi:hypothetical protein
MRPSRRSVLQTAFFAIVDRDAEQYAGSDPTTQEFTWDAYHIEDYLLNPEAIRDACKSLAGRDIFANAAAVEDALKQAAVELVPRLTLEQIQAEVNRDIVGSIAISGAPDDPDVTNSILPSIVGSVARVTAKGQTYTAAHVQKRVDAVQADLHAALEGDGWLKRFPGRSILKRFVDEHLEKVGYEPFRNLILEKLALSEARPAGIAEVLDKILVA